MDDDEDMYEEYQRKSIFLILLYKANAIDQWPLPECHSHLSGTQIRNRQ